MAADRFTLVARNLRRFRHERGHSLGDLARRAGLSKQTLSSIEAGQANPTFQTLSTLADALAIPVAHLLTEYGSPVLVRRGHDAAWSQTADGAIRELDQVYGFGFVRTSLIRHSRAESATTDHQPHRPGTLHHAYLIRGKISIGPSGEEIDLARGDFIRFPGDIPHRTVVHSDTTTLYMVTTVPHVMQLGPNRPNHPR